jgi:hypothetical protein
MTGGDRVESPRVEGLSGGLSCTFFRHFRNYLPKLHCGGYPRQADSRKVDDAAQ